MGENLNYEAGGSRCYKNEPENCSKYGRLYNCITAMNVCPKYWHLPNNGEWDILVNFAGGKETAGKKLKVNSGWDDYKGKSGNGVDAFGFSALPGGFGYSDGSFLNVGNFVRWWSSSEGYVYSIYSRNMYLNYEYVLRNYSYHSYLFSVRCVKD